MDNLSRGESKYENGWCHVGFSIGRPEHHIDCSNVNYHTVINIVIPLFWSFCDLPLSKPRIEQSYSFLDPSECRLLFL